MTPQPETQAFYNCPYSRCPVRFWPVTAGDQCPFCNRQGTYAGTVVKIPTPPPEPDDPAYD